MILRSIEAWFICYGCSYIVAEISCGLTHRGTVFLILSFIIGIIAFFKFDGYDNGETFAKFILFDTFLTLLLTWVSAELASAEFTVAYQIVTFIYCQFENSEKNCR